MRIFTILSGLILLFLLLTSQIFAHLPGQPPFFKVNGVLSDYYPITSDYSSAEFILPQDIAPKPFLVDEDISFEIDPALLPYPPEVIKQMTFHWELGDGEVAEGLQNTYSYQKPGSYELIVVADYGEYNSGTILPTEIQRMLLTVVPKENYTFPKANITINGQPVNSEKGYVEADLSNPVRLSAETSTSPNGTITEYTWNLDNGAIKNGETITVEYKTNPYLVSPILRITDSNGFISDTQVSIKNTGFGKKPFPYVQVLLGIFLFCILIGGIGFVLRKKLLRE